MAKSKKKTATDTPNESAILDHLSDDGDEGHEVEHDATSHSLNDTAHTSNGDETILNGESSGTMSRDLLLNVCKRIIEAGTFTEKRLIKARRFVFEILLEMMFFSQVLDDFFPLKDDDTPFTVAEIRASFLTEARSITHQNMSMNALAHMIVDNDSMPSLQAAKTVKKRNLAKDAAIALPDFPEKFVPYYTARQVSASALHRTNCTEKFKKQTEGTPWNFIEYQKFVSADWAKVKTKEKWEKKATALKEERKTELLEFFNAHEDLEPPQDLRRLTNKFLSSKAAAVERAAEKAKTPRKTTTGRIDPFVLFVTEKKDHYVDKYGEEKAQRKMEKRWNKMDDDEKEEWIAKSDNVFQMTHPNAKRSASTSAVGATPKKKKTE